MKEKLAEGKPSVTSVKKKGTYRLNRVYANHKNRRVFRIPFAEAVCLPSRAFSSLTVEAKVISYKHMLIFNSKHLLKPV